MLVFSHQKLYRYVPLLFYERVPMYGEVKLAFFVYLWYPKTKVINQLNSTVDRACVDQLTDFHAIPFFHQGSDLVYETFLRPLVMQYEPDIEQRLRHLRAKSGQLIMFYIKNFSDKGTTLFLEALNYVVSQGSRVSRTEVILISTFKSLLVSLLLN